MLDEEKKRSLRRPTRTTYSYTVVTTLHPVTVQAPYKTSRRQTRTTTTTKTRIIIRRFVDSESITYDQYYCSREREIFVMTEDKKHPNFTKAITWYVDDHFEKNKQVIVLDPSTSECVAIFNHKRGLCWVHSGGQIKKFRDENRSSIQMINKDFWGRPGQPYCCTTFIIRGKNHRNPQPSVISTQPVR